MKKLILLFCLISHLNSQCHEIINEEFRKKVKFGKIDLNEFNITPKGQDSLAGAIVLFDIGSLSFAISSGGEWVYTLERHKRIKILTKEGYDYANFEVPTFKNNHIKEEIKNFSFLSFNIENGKIEQTKTTRDERFTDKYNSNWTINKYTISNVKEGTILDLKYTIQSGDIYNLRQWYFQSKIPIIWSELTLSVPEYFNYKINFQAITDIRLISQEIKAESFSGTVSNTTQAPSHYNFQCNVDHRLWVAKNVSAFKNEPFITTDDDYLSKVDFELSSTKFPDSGYKNYSSSWFNIIDDLSKYEKFGNYLKPNSYTNELLSRIISPSDSILLKAEKIHSYLKNNIKWNSSENIYTSHKNLKQFIEAKNGNSSDINLSLVHLLKAAEIDAYPMLISTRDNGRHPGIPMLSKFNYVIAVVKYKDEFYMYDATSPFFFVNCPSRNALNHKGLLIDLKNKTGEWKEIYPNTLSRTSINCVFTINDNLDLEGIISNRKYFYDAIRSKSYYKSFTNESEYLKDYSKNKTGLKISKYESDKNADPSIYHENMEVSINDYVEQAGNLLFFNPLLFERTKENPFKSDERLFPVDFGINNEETYKFAFTIPNGYNVDKLPNSISYSLEDKSASFVYYVFHEGDKILITSKITLLKTWYSADNYFGLKELFKHIVAKQAEPIILKKI